MASQQRIRRVNTGDELWQDPDGTFTFTTRIDDPDRPGMKKKIWVQCIVDDVVLGRREAKKFKHAYKGMDEVNRPVTSKVTFKELADQVLAEHGQRATTMSQHESNLRIWLKPLHDRKPAQISPAEYARLVSKPMQQAGHSKSSLTSVNATANLVFGEAVFQKLITYNPTKGLLPRHRVGKPTVREPRVIEPKELFQIFDCLEDAGAHGGNMYTCLQYQCAIGLMTLAGLRIGETLGLWWEDVLFLEQKISLSKEREERQILQSGLYGKLKNEASYGEVEMAGVLAAQLERLWLEQGQPDGKTRVVPMGRSTVERKLELAAERTKLGGRTPTPHDLRHSFGSALMTRIGQDNIDIAYVSKQMRHKNVLVTLLVYAHEYDAVKKSGSVGAAIDSMFAGVFG